MPSPLEAAAAAHFNREAEARSRKYPVPTQSTVIERRLDRFKRADAKVFRTLMKPANADLVIDAIPEQEGDALHALLCGDFVFCDLILRLVNRLGEPLELVITTLSLSVKNLAGIEAMLTRFPSFPLHLVVSSYFQSTNKEIFVALECLAEKFKERFSITIGRSHAKIVLIDYGPAGGCYILETSSNLRSSNCLEQLSVFRERALFEFHREWIRLFEITKAEE